MKNILLIVIMMFSVSQVWAQNLVPATSEDLGEFDRQLSEAQTAARSKEPKAKEAPSVQKKAQGNFGAIVSEEAKKLKDSDQSGRQKMGEWVSGQRRKDEKTDAASGLGRGQDGSKGNAARENPSKGNRKTK